MVSFKILTAELFDEICDFGYPQTTEADTLKLFITTETIRSEKSVYYLNY